MTQSLAINVNGVAHSLEVEPRKLLVYLLRDDLSLTGTHVGCDTSQCGACTVLVDGDAIKSCSMLALQADGASVTTIEGLANDGELHPLQAGFWEKHGLQCGFCTPGMIMAAADLLSRIANPSDDEIRHAIEGNFCRCTGYQNIVAAIREGARLTATGGSVAVTIEDEAAALPPVTADDEAAPAGPVAEQEGVDLADSTR